MGIKLNIPPPPKMVEIRCKKEVNGVRISGPVRFDYDGPQSIEPGETATVPLYMWTALKARKYTCLELVDPEDDPDYEDEDDDDEVVNPVRLPPAQPRQQVQAVAPPANGGPAADEKK